jgi:hypothetical protein
MYSKLKNANTSKYEKFHIFIQKTLITYKFGFSQNQMFSVKSRFPVHLPYTNF